MESAAGREQQASTMKLEKISEKGTETILGDAVAGEPLPEPQERARTGREKLRLPLMLAIVAVVLLGGLFFYLHGGRYESTDNAYLQSGLVAVSANVSGQVVAVEVRENQQVRPGDVLFRIDPASYEAAVHEAEAALATARTQVQTQRASYREGESEIRAAQDQLAYSSGESARQKALLAEGISSRNQYDQARLAEQTARHGINTAQQRNEGVAAALSGDVNAPADRQPAVQQAQAALDRARLNLGYTVVRAAQAGIVTKVNQVQVGTYVTASRPVFTLVGHHLWVEANFKEDQLSYMRIGQRATLKVDAFPDLKLSGRLTTFSPGTGSSFALLPAENATGNWVKVVQRLPVQFEIDSLPRDVPLHAGLSVEVTVDTGHKRHLFGGGTSAAAAGTQ